MSTKLKINLVLLALMALSTWYFLYQIDQYEKVMANFEVQRYHPLKNSFDLDEFMGKPKEASTDLNVLQNPMHALTSHEIALVQQSQKSCYRYLFACNAFLVLAIIVVSKTLNKQQADG